ncbi:hypothetical protein FDA38_40805 [Kribbella jiaozuonensis]|uniref:Uncharacterized protein n=1 Tax=Kribbella jiaozuonensis TaxID=2575441 RepID=A0A4U3LDS1_9ACTN|nr:hypothetical protein FDA38_40805 [Kribbella jiaozuonensis]
MHPYIGKALAEAHQNELLRQAEQHRLVRSARSGRRSWLSRRLQALRARRVRPTAAPSVLRPSRDARLGR